MYVDIIKDKTGRLDIQKYCTIVFQLETAQHSVLLSGNGVLARVVASLTTSSLVCNLYSSVCLCTLLLAACNLRQ